MGATSATSAAGTAPGAATADTTAAGAGDDGAARLARARAHLAAIAGEPRPAGGAAEARARAYAAGVLEGAGYVVREEAFAYSAAVGRYGGPVLGAASAGALLLAAFAGMRDRPAVAGVGLVVALGVLAGAAGVAADRGVRRGPWLRRDGVNLVAEPAAAAVGGQAADPHDRPHVWLVAHLDTKSQMVPMSARAFGAGALAAAWVLGLVLAVVHAFGNALGWVSPARAMLAWPAVAVLAVLGAVPVMLTLVGGRSPGALDDASGVAAVLLAAEELAATGAVQHDGTAVPRAPVGVLLTSAEELALAGARAWAHAWRQDGRAPGVALNCDGVDDVGRVVFFPTGRMPGRLLDQACNAVPEAQTRRAPPGVLMDAVAFGDSEWAALTVSRGTWRSLARVHTPDDSLARLRGDGVPEAADVLARVARLSAALTTAGGAD